MKGGPFLMYLIRWSWIYLLRINVLKSENTIVMGIWWKSSISYTFLSMRSMKDIWIWSAWQAFYFLTSEMKSRRWVMSKKKSTIKILQNNYRIFIKCSVTSTLIILILFYVQEKCTISLFGESYFSDCSLDCGSIQIVKINNNWPALKWIK